MNVPFLDLKAPYIELLAELDPAWHRVMSSGWYVLGKWVLAFEAEYAACRFPISERLAGEVLSIPMGPHLDRASQDAVVVAILRTCA